VTHRFLSDEWIAAAKEIHARYAGKTPPAPKVKMNQIITEVPFGDSVMHTFIDSTSGDLVIDQGSLDDAEVTITIDYATARTMFVDQDATALMQAFMAGKIRIQGDMTKLLALQTQQVDQVAKQVAAEVKAITD
jgi:hypothetical protein